MIALAQVSTQNMLAREEESTQVYFWHRGQSSQQAQVSILLIPQESKQLIAAYKKRVLFIKSKSYHLFLIFGFLFQFLILVNPSHHQYIKKDKGRYSCNLRDILLLNQNVAEIHTKNVTQQNVQYLITISYLAATVRKVKKV